MSDPLNPMFTPGAPLFDATTEMHTAIVAALATFAGRAVGSGFLDIGAEHMAHAVAMVEQMDADGRGDMTLSLARTAERLEADGLREPVFRRAAQLAGTY